MMDAGGYRLTDRARGEALVEGLTEGQIRRIMADTVDQVPISADLWKVTDGRNTAIVSPLDSVITSVSKGSTKRARR